MKIKLIKLIKLTALLLHCFTRIGGIFCNLYQKTESRGCKIVQSPAWSGTTWNGISSKQDQRTNRVQVTLKFKVIFSLGPACGCIITLSSYNRYYTKATEKSIGWCSRQKICIFLSFLLLCTISYSMQLKKSKTLHRTCNAFCSVCGNHFVMKSFSRVPSSHKVKIYCLKEEEKTMLTCEY